MTGTLEPLYVRFSARGWRYQGLRTIFIRLQIRSDPPDFYPVNRRPYAVAGWTEETKNKKKKSSWLCISVHSNPTQHSSIINAALGYLGWEGEFKHWQSVTCCLLAGPVLCQPFIRLTPIPLTVTPPGRKRKKKKTRGSWTTVAQSHTAHQRWWHAFTQVQVRLPV